MALFDKVGDISQFDWQKKIGRTNETNTDNLPTNTTANKKLKDQDWEGQHDKFGGNKGLRTGNLGFDEPFIVKEIGNRDVTAGFDEGLFRGGAVFNTLRGVTDTARLAKFSLTGRGLVFYLKQFYLQAQNARQETRIYNPISLGSAASPFFQLPRHVGYPVFPDVASGDDFVDLLKDAGSALASIETPKYDKKRAEDEDRLGNLHQKRIVDEKGPGEQGLFQSILGLQSNAFTDPLQVVKSMKNSTGGDIKSDDMNNPLSIPNTSYDELQEFNKSDYALGQSGIAQDNEVSVINKGYETQANTNILYDADNSQTAPEASKYNLGRGLVNYRGGLYSVGVSNQLQVPYGGTFGNLKTEELPKDFIKFRIRDAINGKWIIFPAHLGSITDTITPEWTTERYIGRPDSVHLYSGAGRSVSLDFKVAAFTKQEIPLIQEKMNALVGLAYPTFKKILSGDDEERPVAPYIYLTLGDMFNNTPGYFNNITITVEENSNWEIDEGLQIPHYFSVSCEFVHVGKYLPNTLGKHYDVPFLKDSGVGNGNYGVFGKNDPRDGNTKRPDIQNVKDNNHWSKQI